MQSDKMEATLIPENSEQTIEYNGETYYLSQIFETDNNGIGTATDLYGDNYIVAEIRAPKGYLLDSTPHCLSANADYSGTQKITITNMSSYDLPFTGGNGENILIFAIVFGLLFTVFVFRRKMINSK